MIGQAGGIDYVEFVAEYASYDLHGLENFGRAVDLFEWMSSMIKVEQESRSYLASRAVGSGIQNLLFSDVRTVEDVEECVAAVRADTPQTGGRYGATSRRFAGYGLEDDADQYVRALEECVIALMIEKDQAVKNLDALLDVKGVDMVQFGAADYAMSIGKPGRYDDPLVREAEEYVITTALARGVQPRAELGSPDQAGRYLDMGVRHFSIGTDLAILHGWWRENASALRRAIAG